MTKYIFVISTGRCGTTYLSKIFENCVDVDSFHENYPVCNEKEMYVFQKGNADSMRKLVVQKVKQIKSKNKKLIYSETNHCFIKGFGWFVRDHINPKDIGVIILKRDMDSVVKSYSKRINNPFSYMARKWLLSTNKKLVMNDPPSIIHRKFDIIFYHSGKFLPKAFFRFLFFIANDYTKKYFEWYYKETYDMAKEFQKKNTDMKFYECNLEDLNNYENVLYLLEYYNIRPKKSLKKIINKPIN